MRAATPENEPERLAALQQYGILDTPPEPAFDEIARAAAQACGAPMALVSLVDEARQWFKAQVGLGVRETSRDASFCAHAILGRDLLVVPDTLHDERFATNPLVTAEPHLRFYAGAPLETPDGQRLGTLCVLDHVPRGLSAGQADLLRVLARQVMTELELRRSLAAQARMTEERKQVGAALELERAFLRKVIDTQPSLVFVKDWDGRFVLANAALARCYGSTVDGVVGRTDADLNPNAGEVDHFMRDDREVMATRRMKLIPEEPVTGADGEVRWYSTVKVPLIEEDGSCNKVLGVASDITAHKEAVAALRESERLHRTLGEAAPGFVWMVSPEGRFEYTNRTWEEFTGSSLEELNAHGWERFNHPDELPEIRRRWAEAFSQGSPFEMELRYRRRDGEYRWMLSRVVPVTDEQGTVTRWVGSSVDIHDLKQVEAARRAAQERLRQAQKMEAVGRLAGGVAHDLNNMLVAILGYSTFVAQSLDPDDSRAADVAEITKAASRSAALTQQLLAFARRDMVRPRSFDLNTTILASERIFRSALGTGTALELDLDAGLGPVYADPTRIEQVLLNLVLNARDAMPRGGRLVIETREVLLDELYAERHPGTEVRPGRYVRLSVSDTGHGMDRQTLARVFEPFFTTKAVGQGTGLGLSMAYGSVKQAGGFIWAYSEPEQGSVFKVYLPEAVEPAELPSAVPEPPPPAGGSVLVVDDDEAVRAITCRALEQEGYTCAAAASGAEALAILQNAEQAVDLVVTDVVMPEMGGRELAVQVEKVRPGLPVLFLSGYSEADVVRRGLLEEGRPYLAKPFTPDTIAAAAGELLRRPAERRH